MFTADLMTAVERYEDDHGYTELRDAGRVRRAAKVVEQELPRIIFEARNDHDLTAAEIARELGCDDSYVHRVLRTHVRYHWTAIADSAESRGVAAGGMVAKQTRPEEFARGVLDRFLVKHAPDDWHTAQVTLWDDASSSDEPLLVEERHPETDGQ